MDTVSIMPKLQDGEVKFTPRKEKSTVFEENFNGHLVLPEKC
jgi:hypothetical protein